MISQPLVSVIVPTYNRSAQLKKCVASILAQTYSKIEVIICDDGSDDNTEEIITEFQDSRLTFLKCGRNGRPAVPRNIGISASRGEWLAFLDSDDEWQKEKLKKQLDTAISFNLQIVCTNARINLSNKSYFTQKNTFSVWSLSDLLKENFVICSSVLARKDLILATGGFDDSPDFTIGEDYLLWLNAVSRSKTIGYLPEPLTVYTTNSIDSVRASPLFADVDLQIAIRKKLLISQIMQYQFCQSFKTFRSLCKNLLRKLKVSFK